MSKFVKLSFVLSFILGMSAIAFGQSTVTGAIGGVVANPNKEVVPNAAVTVRNTETNRSVQGCGSSARQLFRDYQWRGIQSLHPGESFG